MPEHKRKCFDCGNVAMHEDNIVPWVLCKKCGSQDTRKVREPVSETEREPSGHACESCGIDLSQHLGLFGTCKELTEAKAKLAEAEGRSQHFAAKARQRANVIREAMDDPQCVLSVKVSRAFRAVLGEAL